MNRLNAVRTIRLGCAVAACVAVLSFAGSGKVARGQAATKESLGLDDPMPGPVILAKLKAFREVGSVLMVAAHPDDENTQLLAYLENGRHYRTAYLSVTRGDGGQNLLGPEFGPTLGVIRTQELLAARRIDGPEQFFTRALDFGYSKDYQDTLQRWGHEAVLGDVVRVVREFRPDVIVARFSPLPSATHGHHTASAVLAEEAFKAAADPKMYPEQGLAPWQAKRVVVNRGGPGGGGGGGVQMDIGGNDEATGESFASMAARSRSMHKTQGFGGFANGGGRGAGGPRMESFELLAGEPMSKDLLDGVDTTWGRVEGGAEIGKMADGVIAGFDVKNPAGSVEAVLAMRKVLIALPGKDPIAKRKREELDRILQGCLGLTVGTTTDNAEAVPGETIGMMFSAMIKSDIPVTWIGFRYPNDKEPDSPIKLIQNSLAISGREPETYQVPDKTPISQPYWLREEPGPGQFNVDDSTLIGRPENRPVFPVSYLFEVGGQTLVVPDEPVKVVKDGDKIERRRMSAVPPITLNFAQSVRLFSPSATRDVDIDVTAQREQMHGTVSLVLPPDWKAEPASQAFVLAKSGDKKKFKFSVTAPTKLQTASITADAEVTDWNGRGSIFHATTDRQEISFKHLPTILLQPTARLKAVSLELATKGKVVGYLPGAGDSVADAIAEMGYTVKTLTGDDLTAETLGKLDAVVVGIRAFNVRADLPPKLDALFEYVNNGGTVVEQYNTPNGLLSPKFTPYVVRLSSNLPANRVTDPEAAVTLLAPDNPVLNTPNKIVQSDFSGWVQERGVNMPNDWDHAHFVALLACSDKGEKPLESGILVAKYGKGTFVYTGLSFFRQLPAGVPGAYRLFANMVSAGK